MMSSDPLNPYQSHSSNPAQRLILFALLFFGIMIVMNKFFPTPKPEESPPPAVVENLNTENLNTTENTGEGNSGESPTLAETVAAEEFVTLGSLDPDSGYRMLVTLSNRGAAVRRVELTDPKYYDIDTRHGWLGELVVDTVNVSEGGGAAERKPIVVGDTEVTIVASPDSAEEMGKADSLKRADRCIVECVGPGTPAASAGIRIGDEILAIDGHEVTGRNGLATALASTKPGQTVTVRVRRVTDAKPDGAEEDLSATLAWKPVELIRPERDAPGSFLVTLQQVDGVALESPFPQPENDLRAVAPDPLRELNGVKLLHEPWKVEIATPSCVVFMRTVPKYDLEVRKIFTLKELPGDTKDSEKTAAAYRIGFSVETKNVGQKSHSVAYRFDGPNGLPTEAWWYSMKVSREWGQTLGVRDVVYGVERNKGYLKPFAVAARNVATGEVSPETELNLASAPLTYMGVDAVYFTVAMLPQYPDGVAVEDREGAFTRWRPVRYGPVEPKHEHLANTSFILTGKSVNIAPEASTTMTIDIFAGPKQSALLDAYGLSSLLYFGWFSWISRLLLGFLHLVTAVCPYVIGIIVLTIVVRLLIFPLSRVQTVNSLKMQQIQPEMARVREKYKTDPMAMRRAQAELFRKYNFKPQIGCLLIFVQLPIFMGLWRGVMLDVEARGESLLGRGVAWCRDLSAPDRLFAWDSWMPKWLADGSGWLGPYFNLLPIIVLVLFLWQQKKMMPAPTDDQGRMQQKMMKFMMIFMGFLFFKVPSGLCIYMIIVTFWGVCERKLLPKSLTSGLAATAGASATIDVKAIDPRNRPKPKKKKKR